LAGINAQGGSKPLFNDSGALSFLPAAPDKYPGKYLAQKAYGNQGSRAPRRSLKSI